MNKYWLNGNGKYDPTLTKVIERENAQERKARNKEVHYTIQEIKNLLNSRNLKMINRIQIQDKNTGKKYF